MLCALLESEKEEFENVIIEAESQSQSMKTSKRYKTYFFFNKMICRKLSSYLNGKDDPLGHDKKS